MKARLEFIGPSLHQRDERGRLPRCVGTLFVTEGVAITEGSMHALQRQAYLDRVSRARVAEGLPPYNEAAQADLFGEAVSFFSGPEGILIRPDPDHTELAFRADKELQECASKHEIRYLYPHNPKVLEALRRQGELWRIAPLPRTRDEIIALIENRRASIGGLPIYRHNQVTGTRFLTFDEFRKLGEQGDEVLRQHLVEIARFVAARNTVGNAEVAFFAVDGQFGPKQLQAVPWAELAGAELRAEYERLREDFRAAVAPGCEQDDVRSAIWQKEMYSALVSPPDQPLSDHILAGLSAEFFLKIEWLPGAAFDNGELIFDSVFEEDPRKPAHVDRARLCDDKVRGFILNCYRELGDLEYINIGRIPAMSRPVKGRREVFIAELKPVDGERMVRMIRMQRWGIREHLLDRRSLLEAIFRAQEYTQFVLNRRLGCRQLGMKLVPRIAMRQVIEQATHPEKPDETMEVWATYFERDYVWGAATDKLPKYKLSDEAYSLRLARLMGAAAALNLIAGRVNDAGEAVFDAGDEVVKEGLDGLPSEIIVTDHAGTFMDFDSDLGRFAKDYARAANDRLTLVPKPRQFATSYVAGFVERFREVQAEYERRPEAFTRLFSNLRYDPKGNFKCRWECIIKRMKEADPEKLGGAIRAHITVPNRPANG